MTEVLPAQSPSSGSPYLSASPLRPTHPPNRSFMLEASAFASSNITTLSQEPQLDASSESSSVTSSPRPDKSSLSSTPPSSISLDNPDQDEEELFFPSYGGSERIKSHHPESSPVPADAHSLPPYESPVTSTNGSVSDSPSLMPADDTAVHDEPSRQVDYLSHEWTEEDVCQSWRHIVSNRRTFGERSRLENASWRTWTKSKYSLQTVSPELLNWQKECDVTWLYGPLQEARRMYRHPSNPSSGTHGPQSEPGSNMSKNNSFVKRPILKKRSVSEVMLQKSLSSSSLVKQAAAAVQAQRRDGSRDTEDCRRLSRSNSDSGRRGLSTQATSGFASMINSEQSSGLQSPEAGGGKHIRFDDKVEQCIAVDFKPGSSSEDMASNWSKELSSDTSDDDLVMMRSRTKRQSSTPGSRRDSLGQESKGIVKLPSTTLKYHHDEPYCPGHPDAANQAWRAGRLQSSSSSETLRPTKPSANFLLDDGEDDLSWEPSGAFDTPRPGSAAGLEETQTPSSNEELPDAPDGLRRTPSGMFMPFEEEDPNFTSNGVFGRVVDTVNTARDIFSVIMNVGWRS